jgi:hypothetical protein
MSASAAWAQTPKLAVGGLSPAEVSEPKDPANANFVPVANSTEPLRKIADADALLGIGSQ